ncbi:MAG TPA: hypothetical protein VFI17_00750 [Solirubrobacterales bacterium]|nr:hypothetical protein [Solirubrobacterales bacterium]
MRPESITVPRRFNGPRESGNGGYASGLIAQALGGRAEVSLRSPVPLDVPLEVARESTDEGERLRVSDGETLVAEARPSGPLAIDLPAPVDRETARRAAAGYRGPHDGIFSHCFVCGRARGDSLEVYAGEVEGRELVASLWTPPPWAAGADGSVSPELVWAVLDCPTYFATYLGEEPALAFLVSQTVEIHATVAVGEEHVVVAWPLAVEGRKRGAGAALLAADGTPLASCRALLVEPAAPSGSAAAR